MDSRRVVLGTVFAVLLVGPVSAAPQAAPALVERFVITAAHAVVTASVAPLLPFPGAPSVIGIAKSGETLRVTNQFNGYFAVLTADGGVAWAPAAMVRLTGDAPEQVLAPGARVILEAMRFFGMPYEFGGSDHSLDCSLLVQTSFKACGAQLPRTAAEQATVGTPVEVNALRPGDRLYFSSSGDTIDHTGLYLGAGWFVHASASQGKVWADSLAEPLWKSLFVSARR